MGRILVTGGAYQGKTDWVNNKYRDIIWVKSADDMTDTDNKIHIPAINNLHLLAKKWAGNKTEAEHLLKILTEMDNWIVVSDEIGSGIVPVDKSERLWREETGRLLCRIAAISDEVYRVQLGIPVLIKGVNDGGRD